MTRAIAVGDIHGCSAQLLEILALVRGYPDHDLVFLGDYIDRGPDAEGVCAILKGLPGIFLKGNHEAMLLERAARRPDRLPALLEQAGLSPPSLEWLATALKPYHKTEDYLFVHAGLDPRKAWDLQTEADFLWSRHEGDYPALGATLLIHGHSVVPRPEIVGNRINLNTGCGSGGPLTALVLPEMVYLTSSPSPGREGGLSTLLEELKAEFGDFGELEEV